MVSTLHLVVEGAQCKLSIESFSFPSMRRRTVDFRFNQRGSEMATKMTGDGSFQRLTFQFI